MTEMNDLPGIRPDEAAPDQVESDQQRARAATGAPDTAEATEGALYGGDVDGRVVAAEDAAEREGSD